MKLEPRIIELEIRYTQQQATLQELSEVLISQQRELDLLRREVSVLQSKLQGDPGVVDATQKDLPPHY